MYTGQTIEKNAGNYYQNQKIKIVWMKEPPKNIVSSFKLRSNTTGNH